VKADTPAERAGIEVGDALISVDGKSLAEIGIPALAEYFMTDNRVVYLVLGRDDETYERSITLKEVL